MFIVCIIIGMALEFNAPLKFGARCAPESVHACMCRTCDV